GTKTQLVHAVGLRFAAPWAGSVEFMIIGFVEPHGKSKEQVLLNDRGSRFFKPARLGLLGVKVAKVCGAQRRLPRAIKTVPLSKTGAVSGHGHIAGPTVGAAFVDLANELHKKRFGRPLMLQEQADFGSRPDKERSTKPPFLQPHWLIAVQHI